MAKPQSAATGALGVVEGMDDVLFDAWMCAKLLDHLVASGFAEHENGNYLVTQNEGDLISFASGKMLAAVRACQDQLGALDPRSSQEAGTR